MGGKRLLGDWKVAKRYLPLFLTSAFLLTAQTSSVPADWREDIGVFRIGIIADDTIVNTLAKVEPFRKVMQGVLGIDVEILPARDFSTLIDAQISGRLEYAIYSASAYATAYTLCKCVEPLVLATAFDQTKGYQAAIISRPDGPKTPSEVDLGNFGMTDPRFIGSNSFALHTLKLGGTDFTNQKNILISKTNDELVDNLISGELTAILGWSSFTGNASTGYSRGTMKRIAEKSGGKSIGYRAIWKSLPIPHGPHTVLKKLPSEVSKMLQDTLTGMFSNNPQAYDAIEPEFSGGFATVKHSAYLPMIKFIESLGKSAAQNQ